MCFLTLTVLRSRMSPEALAAPFTAGEAQAGVLIGAGRPARLDKHELRSQRAMDDIVRM
jgi:hypothetical protein